MRMTRALIPMLASLAILAGIAGAVVWGFLYVEFRAPFKGQTFDMTAWQAGGNGSGQHDCRRCPMVADLTANHLPRGRAGVVLLLGDPEKTGVAARDQADCDAYRLGLDLRASAWWSEAWYYVCYDENNADGSHWVSRAFPLVY